jgi:hypothetical protein
MRGAPLPAMLAAMNDTRALESTFVTRCAWCERYEVACDWVPEPEHDASHEAPTITHGVCPECAHGLRAAGQV